MKLISLALLFAFLGFVSYGQKLEGYVVNNANDTIPCKFIVRTNMITKNLFYAASVYKSLKIQNAAGEKIKYLPADIKSFYIKGTTDGDYKFVSIKEDGYRHFYHEVVKDRISYYHLYKVVGNVFPNSIYDEFAYKDDTFIEVGIAGTREALAVLLKDNPEIYDKWADAKTSYYKTKDAFNIVNQYNDSYKKKNILK